MPPTYVLNEGKWLMKLAELFQNHMVIQREKNTKIWGECASENDIIIEIQGKRTIAKAENGYFIAELPPLTASLSERLCVSCGSEKIIVEDVAVGEVWLAGGQSNMEFQMLFDDAYEQECGQCENPMIRFFDYPEVSYEGQREDFDYSEMSVWRLCDKENLKFFSAPAYYMAKEIAGKLKVPVGILGCNWGGTTASAWMSEDYLKRHGQVWIDDYNNGLKKITDLEAYKEDFKNNPANGRGRLLEDPVTLFLMPKPGLSLMEQRKFMEKMGIVEGETLVDGPYSEKRPSGLYHTMLEKVAPYTVRGVLWYQGESDELHADIYKDVLSDMIECWRALWTEKLPFIIAQIAPFERWMLCSGEKFPVIRQAQYDVSKSVEDVFMISTSDVGMQYDIHPKRKEPVGIRMALSALRYVYGEDVCADAPEAVSLAYEDGMLCITFRYAEGGLVLKGEKIQALAVRCEGEEADISLAKIKGNQILIPVKESCTYDVQFAQTDYYEVNLYNQAGLPAVPFVLKIGGLK